GGRGDRERHELPCDRDAELDAGRGRVSSHLRYPPEKPEVDSGDRDPVADRDPRVPELVEEDRREEEEGARRRQQERAGRVVAGDRVLVVAGEPPDEEEEGDEPARIDADANP